MSFGTTMGLWGLPLRTENIQRPTSNDPMQSPAFSLEYTSQYGK